MLAVYIGYVDLLHKGVIKSFVILLWPDTRQVKMLPELSVRALILPGESECSIALFPNYPKCEEGISLVPRCIICSLARHYIEIEYTHLWASSPVRWMAGWSAARPG